MTNDECLSLISNLIVGIDQKISQQLSKIIQHKNFRELEALWRSLFVLVNTEYSTSRVKIKVLDISWGEISKDLNLSYDIKHTSLYYKIYSKELDTAGGFPYGALAICHRLSNDNNNDDYFTNDFDDIYTTQLLGELGDVCLCQILIGLDEYFFGDNPDAILHNQERIQRIVQSQDFIAWQNLRKNKSSRFLNIVFPDYLVRKPYENYFSKFVFNETLTGACEGLWGNAVFLLVSNIIREFSRISWFGFLRAYDENGEHGAVVKLPKPLRVVPKSNFSVESDNYLSDFGLTVLSNVYLTDFYGFYSNSSVKYSKNDTEKVINMMQTNLMSCRFSHYIKVILRDKVANYDTPEDCKKFLDNWISKYVMNSSFADESIVSQYPLKNAEIEVFARKDDATVYDCEVKIEPQYQYDLSTVSITLLTSARNINHKNIE